MIMGCTAPSARPSKTEHTPMLQGVGMKGYKPNSTPVQTMAPVMIWYSCTWRDSQGKHTRMKAAEMANAPKMVPTTEAL